MFFKLILRWQVSWQVLVQAGDQGVPKGVLSPSLLDSADGLLHPENHKIWLEILVLLFFDSDHLRSSENRTHDCLPTIFLLKNQSTVHSFQTVSSIMCGVIDDFSLCHYTIEYYTLRQIFVLTILVQIKVVLWPLKHWIDHNPVTAAEMRWKKLMSVSQFEHAIQRTVSGICFLWHLIRTQV